MSEKQEFSNFIHDFIDQDLLAGKYQKVHTRFPPEPNGYLHIGHAKSICLNFGTAEKYGGLCNLRFDDTNPAKEEQEFIDSIKADVHWLGFDWDDRLFYASDYFEEIYNFAVELIKKGLAYVCHLNAEEMRDHRGTVSEPGTSPYRDRSIEENLDLFERMRNGEFPDGHCTLRAKIDMGSSNFNMRDPVLYRIQRSYHQRTGNKWCIYPMYDFAHPLSDALESITHSICTLEFENHRPLYDWVLNNVTLEQRSRQIEFARLNLTHTVMSKRKLRQLVEEGYVDGWDDPRMPTISGLRRRGYTPEAIRLFCEKIGVAKANSMVDISLLEHCIRDDLNVRAPRAMAVLRPLKVVITNYPAGQLEMLPGDIHPDFPERGAREIPFGREIYIEEEDFMENPPSKFFRLRPGGEVRLKSAYIITCEKVIKDENGKITELCCTYDPQTRSGSGCTRKVKGTIHWVEATQAQPVEVRLYDHLFIPENPEDVPEDKDFKEGLNPESLTVLNGLMEPAYAANPAGRHLQFLRHGYFYQDTTSTPDKPVYNRVVSLKDTWNKIKNQL